MSATKVHPPIYQPSSPTPRLIPPHSPRKKQQQALIALDNVNIFRVRIARVHEERSALTRALASLSTPAAHFALLESGISVARNTAGGEGGGGGEVGGAGGDGCGGSDGGGGASGGGSGGGGGSDDSGADGGLDGLWTADELVDLLADNALNELQMVQMHWVMVGLAWHQHSKPQATFGHTLDPWLLLISHLIPPGSLGATWATVYNVVGARKYGAHVHTRSLKRMLPHIKGAMHDAWGGGEVALDPYEPPASCCPAAPANPCHHRSTT